MKSASPFRRDFTLMVIGQIISLFGNAILRFSLSLHVLSLTGSAAVFGSILALAMVPTVLLSPLAGCWPTGCPGSGLWWRWTSSPAD